MFRRTRDVIHRSRSRDSNLDLGFWCFPPYSFSFLFFSLFLSPSPETRAVEMHCLLIVTAQNGNQFAISEINKLSTVREKPK